MSKLSKLTGRQYSVLIMCVFVCTCVCCMCAGEISQVVVLEVKQLDIFIFQCSLISLRQGLEPSTSSRMACQRNSRDICL